MTSKKHGVFPRAADPGVLLIREEEAIHQAALISGQVLIAAFRFAADMMNPVSGDHGRILG